MEPAPPSNEKPNALIAALCGILAPGAGLLYAGRWRLAIGVAVAFLLLAVLVPWGVVDGGAELSRLPDLIVAASLSLWVPALVFGVIAAVMAPARPGPRPPWRHPWWVFGFVLLTHAGASIVRGQVAERVALVVVVDRQLPRLQLEPPAAFVVARRGFDPASVVPGELVAARREERAVVARVDSVDGRAIRVDLGAGELFELPPEDLLGRAVRTRR